jgi:uncharacterized protein (DUF488 family)
VVDVRSLTRSRRYPQFNRETLTAALGKQGMSYRHCMPLESFCQPLDPADPVNRWIRNERFRASADHMQTAEFADAVTGLIDVARSNRCAVMCAESVQLRCHRSLLADALVTRWCRVLHVIDRDRTEWHRFAPVRALSRHGAVVAPPSRALQEKGDDRNRARSGRYGRPRGLRPPR